ncbi:MurR/RpiR family transcriptional regulator [Sciscionella sediminilitoris]|uniref:MurR/RpiR family transcriptional regulator n=1 Tax=Sciscionella sediminilitoris TaxID=1445613 RepID=UPI001E544788|nr:MurR/RpiR family transcriptional regulator [Sciscionella sp. SE31]
MATTSSVWGRPLADRIAAHAHELTATELRVAEYLDAHGEEVIFATAGGLAKAIGTSDATVVRTARALGYSGLPELKHEVGQQLVQVNKPAARLRQRIEHVGAETGELLDEVFAEGAERLAETRRLSRAGHVRACIDCLAEADAVVGYGVGVSALAADYLATRLTRIGKPARAISATGFRLADELLSLTGGEALVLYAPGRMLAELEVILEHAHRVGAKVVLVSDALAARIGDRVDHALTAVHSGSGLTGECLASVLLTDALVLGVAARDQDRATAASDLLTALRGRLGAE